MKNFTTAGLAGLALMTGMSAPALAQSVPFVGQVTPTAASYCPRGWADANGQILQISQNDALFSLYGTIYGGDGRTTFALPDMRGRFSTHASSNPPGLTPHTIGSRFGETEVYLTVQNLASHNHTYNASADGGSQQSLQNGALGTYTAPAYSTAGNINVSLAADAIRATGSSAVPTPIQQPYLAVRYCVALFGVYPSRN